LPRTNVTALLERSGGVIACGRVIAHLGHDLIECIDRIDTPSNDLRRLRDQLKREFGPS
jgi:hypothetical protein